MSKQLRPSAEAVFLKTLLSNEPLDKEAVGLDPDIQEMLGAESVSPRDLDAIEASAAAAPQKQSESEPEVGPPERIDLPPEEEQEAAPDRSTHGKLFSDRRAHPVLLLETLTNRYGTEWADWEPETTWWAIRKDFGPVGVQVREKVMALRLAAISDMPWLDWDVFEKCGVAWNDIMPAFGDIQLMSPAQLAFTTQVLRDVRDDEPFSHEVSAYMAAILNDHGYAYAPEEWFPGAQDILDRRDWIAEFRDEVAEAWPIVQRVNAEDVEWNESEFRDMHLLKLSMVKRYLDERAVLRNEEPGAAVLTTAVPPVP